MQASKDDFARECKGFRHWLETTSGRIFEAMCKYLVADDVPGFVYSAEGATVDCALFVPARELRENDVDGRLQVATRRLQDTNLLLLDNKVLSYVLDLRPDHRGTYHFEIHQSARQGNCIAFIAQNPAAPHLVALLPLPYLQNMHRAQLVQIRRVNIVSQAWTHTSRSQMLTGLVVEPFPIEWSPVIMKTEHLWLPLKTISQNIVTGGDITSWKNPTTGLSHETGISHQLFENEYLLPERGNMLRNEGIRTRELHAALCLYSQKYYGEEFSVRPLIGDFAIRDKLTLKRITVELKQSEVRLTHRNSILHHRSRSYAEKLIFTPFAQWDLILMTARKNEFGLLVPRSELPLDWFYNENPPRELQQNVTLEWVTRWHVCFDSPQSMVGDIERILELPEVQQYFDVGVPELPFRDVMRNSTETTVEPIKDVGEETWKDSSDEEGDKTKSEPLMTSRSLMITEHHLLLEQCRRRNSGWVYALGSKHPSATHAFVPDIIPGITFADLHPRTPMMLINFAEIDQLDQRWVSDNRRSKALLRATHGLSPSIWILYPSDSCLRRPELNCFVVPSEMLASDRRRKMSNKVLRCTSFNQLNRNYVWVFDTRAVTSDTFACRRRHVIDLLHNVCRDAWKNPKPVIGDEFGVGLGFMLDLDNYIVTKLEVSKQFLRYAQGLPLWTPDSE